MNKSLITSVSPQECELIASGKQTMLVRKTRPKIETPFKNYIYCTKGKSRLISVQKDGDVNYCGEVYHGKTLFIKCPQIFWNKKCENICGKVIGEFVCDRIHAIHARYYDHGSADLTPDKLIYVYDKNNNTPMDELEFEDDACLTHKELFDYTIKKDGWACGWHISDLKIYDKPKELGEFSYSAEHNFTKRTIKESREMGFICHGVYITRPPKSWCYVEELG